jgi:hypothetical protein
MTRYDAPSVGIRDVLRLWPLIIIPVLIAVTAGAWSASREATTYTATSKLVVVPLAQWDETFIGTSLVRDAGDANRTAATVAALLNSPRAAVAAADYLGSDWTPDAVDKAVDASVVDQANVIEIVSRSADAERAARLVDGFTQAALADRWRTISAELDARISALTAIAANLGGNADASAGEVYTRLQTLTLVREAGTDPTIRLDSTGSVVRNEPSAVWAVGLLATAGGLVVGLLAAVGMARLKRRLYLADPPPTPHDESTLPYSPTSRS